MLKAELMEIIAIGENSGIEFKRDDRLRVMAFTGIDKEYQASLDVVLDASLVGRWNINESGKKQLVDEGLIEKICVNDNAIHNPRITEYR